MVQDLGSADLTLATTPDPIPLVAIDEGSGIRSRAHRCRPTGAW
jgi:hypothetical protein